MADIRQPRLDDQSADILYQTFANSVWINACSPMWASAVTMDQQAVKVPDITANTGVDFPADSDALQTAPTIKFADMSSQQVVRQIIRGYCGYDKMQVRQGLAGQSIEAWQNQQLAIELSLGVDGKIREAVQAISFKAPSASGNKNLVEVGVKGANSEIIDRNFPYQPKVNGTGNLDEAKRLVWDSILFAKTLLGEKKVIIPQGQAIGSNAPSMAAAIMPIGLSKSVIQYLADRGDGTFQAAGDVNVTAGREATGLGSMTQFEGRAWGVDIWTDLSMTAPAAGKKWEAYVVPTNGPIVADFALIDRSERDFSAGTTEHKFSHDVVQIGLFGVKVLRPEHVIKVAIESELGS